MGKGHFLILEVALMTLANHGLDADLNSPSQNISTTSIDGGGLVCPSLCMLDADWLGPA